jgi:alkyldihydroxyacetonephosphate synthase
MSGAAGAQPPGRPRCWWGWGWEDEQLGAEALADLALRARSLLGSAELRLVEPPSLDALELPPPRIAPPAPLAHLCSAEHSDRARHAFGRSFGDVVRALAGQITHPPDLVAHPGSEREVADVLEWASEERVAVVPFGGGSSLTRGVEPDVGDDYAGTLSLDLRRLDAVLEVDHHSLAARIQAGAYGPAIESQLAPHRLSLRHFPP